MISQSLTVDPRDPKPLLVAFLLAMLLPKERLESFLLALGSAPMWMPYLRHLMSRR